MGVKHSKSLVVNFSWDIKNLLKVVINNIQNFSCRQKPLKSWWWNRCRFFLSRIFLNFLSGSIAHLFKKHSSLTTIYNSFSFFSLKSELYLSVENRKFLSTCLFCRLNQQLINKLNNMFTLHVQLSVLNF